jgi:hypothetical protein
MDGGCGDDRPIHFAGEFAVVGEGSFGGIYVYDGGEFRSFGLADYAAVILPEGSGSDYGDSGLSHGSCV